MRCHEARRLFFLHYDDELDTRGAQEVHLHLEHCPRCRRHWAFESAVEQATARAAWRIPGTEPFDWPGLEERIRTAAQDAHRAREVRRRRLRAAGGAGVVLAAIALFAAHLLAPGPVGAAAAAAAAHHRKYVAGGSPLQVSAPPREVARFFAGELEFAVHVPDASFWHRLHDADAPELRLAGARRCTFLQSPVAYVAYEVNGRDLTVILGPRHPPALLLEAITDAPDGVVRTECLGHRVIFASLHGVLFTAVGDAPFAELVDLLQAFQAAGTSRVPEPEPLPETPPEPR